MMANRTFSSSAINILDAVIKEIDNSSVSREPTSESSDLVDVSPAWVFQIDSLSSTVDSTAACCLKQSAIEWRLLSFLRR